MRLTIRIQIHGHLCGFRDQRRAPGGCDRRVHGVESILGLEMVSTSKFLESGWELIWLPGVIGSPQ